MPDPRALDRRFAETVVGCVVKPGFAKEKYGPSVLCWCNGPKEPGKPAHTASDGELLRWHTRPDLVLDEIERKWPECVIVQQRDEDGRKRVTLQTAPPKDDRIYMADDESNPAVALILAAIEAAEGEGE